MTTFSDTLHQTFSLLLQLDESLWGIILLSLKVSGTALLFAVIIGLPIALGLTLRRFPGERLLYILVDTMMALPPVVVGLVVYLLLSRSGPLGVWGLLYTPTAMIIAQTLLITPIVIALALPLFKQHWSRIGEQLIVLGYRPRHILPTLLYEARAGIMTVILAAFGRGIAEIGAVMIVGGNIDQHTRVMTTAIAMETQQGNLALALALGIVLIMIALLINSSAHLISASINAKGKRHIQGIQR
jgi:tungstate transport system permease protein